MNIDMEKIRLSILECNFEDIQVIFHKEDILDFIISYRGNNGTIDINNTRIKFMMKIKSEKYLVYDQILDKNFDLTNQIIYHLKEINKFMIKEIKEWEATNE